MLIHVRNLVDRLRHSPSRAEGLAALRGRFARAPKARDVGPEIVEVARRLRELRVALTAAIGDVDQCGRCAKGHPLPAGRFAGGHCCSGPTEGVFTDVEIAALALGGTDVDALEAPRTEHAGCVFRGADRCTIEGVDRPNICVRYVCLDLGREIDGLGRKAEVNRLKNELGKTFDHFAKLLEAAR